MNWLKRNFWDIFFVSIFLILGITLSFKNYTPNTWLTGWDNLHPEFNFYLNIKRSLFALWQEYQGMGLLGGMGHAADLPRQLILWGLSYIIPVNFLRYFWTFLMLIAGPVGVYFLVSKKLIKDSGFLNCVSGFVAGIFYLFNLATLQTFYTPFETFMAFYGLLPWLLYFATGYLNTGKKSNLLRYFLFSIIGVCAFYVQTLFVVYAFFLTIIAIERIIISFRSGFWISFKLALVTFSVNAFWLLPVLFFSFTSSGVISQSHINSIATPETQIMNQARGNLGDIATLKGYWFDYYDWEQTRNDWNSVGNYDYLYRDWINYLSNPALDRISLAIFGVAVLGLALGTLKKKINFRFSFLLLGLISYFMLAGSNPPFGNWFDLLTQKIPLFGEIFRNSFTKWGTATSLIYAIGLGFFVYIISDIFKSKFKYFLAILLTLIVVSGSVFVVLPFFDGKLISKSMQADIPQDYLDLFKFLQNQDKTKRIANFPMLNFWGWDFYKWGYRGSGFVWHGIEQPILDRAFDVWSSNNENFYNETVFAVNYGSSADLESVLEKYQISYILFDESIYDPGNKNSYSVVQQQKSLLESLQFIRTIKTFGSLTVYEVNQKNDIKAFVSAPKLLPNETPITNVNDLRFIKPNTAPLISEVFPNTQGYPDGKNCELNGNGNIIKETSAVGNYYGATNGGVSCDYFYYPTLDYSDTYVMRIKGRNLSGRSLKFYLFNVKSGNIDRLELLPTGDFNNYYLIPPTGKGKKEGPARVATQSVAGGYTLNLETRSYGVVSSENIVSKIEFYPVDYNYLQTFKDTVFKGEYSMQNNLEILSVKKLGSVFYKIDVKNSGLIQLGQGYDKGWIALQLSNTSYQLSILEHVKVNSWANGWMVPPSNQVTNNQTSVLIVFWPQLLEWGGAFLGIISFIILVLIGSKSTHNT